MDVQEIVKRIDGYQQRRRWLAFPLAVVKKFGDDQAGNLAALIAYYGFFSLFPLLLVLVSVLGIVLRGNLELLGSIRRSALGQFPVIGDQIRVRGLTASGLALAVGIVAALWAGLGVTQAGQTAMNEVWDVPKRDRPNFLISRVRGLVMLAVLGTFVLLSTFLSGLGTGSGSLGPSLRSIGVLGSLLANLALFMVAFRVLTRRNLTWGDVLPGAACGAVAWTGLQLVGNYYITHQIKNATAVYGTFALVIGLLVWLHLGAQVTLFAAEINVVRKGRLWPRSIVQPPLEEADRRALRRGAEVEERISEEDVEVSFDREAVHDPPPEGDGNGDAGPGPGGRAFIRALGLGTLGGMIAAGVVAVRRRRGSGSG